MLLCLKHIAIAVTVFWFAYSQTEDRECPPSWITNGNFCYFIHPNSSTSLESDFASWSEAQAACRSQHSSRLLYYDSENERRFINQQIDPPFSNGYLWIGLRQYVSTGPYIWENGVELSPADTHWEVGQPDNREGDEYCIDVLTGDTKATGIWRDRQCSEEKGFICKFELGVEVIFPDEPSVSSTQLMTSSIDPPLEFYTTVFESYSSVPEAYTPLVTEFEHSISFFEVVSSTVIDYVISSSEVSTFELSSTTIMTSYYSSTLESSSLVELFVSSSHIILTPSSSVEPTSSITMMSSSLIEITSSTIDVILEALTSSPVYISTSQLSTSSLGPSLVYQSSMKTPLFSTTLVDSVLPTHPSFNESSEWCTQEILNGITWYPTLAGVVVSIPCPNTTDYRHVTRSCIAAQSTGIWINSNFTSCDQREPHKETSWLIVVTYICASITVFLLLAAVLVLISLRFLDTSTMVVRCCLALSMTATVIFFIITFETENHHTICRLAVVGYQYWLTAQFLWMLLESMRLYVGVTSRKNAVRTWVYHFTGWALPFVLVLICAVMYFEEYDQLVRCFRKWHMFLCFLIPVVVLIIVLFIFLLVFNTQHDILLNRNYSQSSAHGSSKRESLRKELRGTFVLFILLSSCWVTSLAAVKFNSESLQQAFAILMLLEGLVFVLIYIVFNEGVKDALQPHPKPTVIEMKCETRTNRHGGTNHFMPINTTHRFGQRGSSIGRRLSHSDTFRSTTLSSHNKFGVNLRRNSIGSSTIGTGDSSNTSTGVTTCDDSSAYHWYDGSVRSRPGGRLVGSHATESSRGGSEFRSSKIHRRKHKARNTVLEHKILQHVRVEEMSSRRKRTSRRSKKRHPLQSETSSSSFTNSSTHSGKTLSTSLKSKPNPFSSAKVAPSFDEPATDSPDLQQPISRCLSWSKPVDNAQSPPIQRISLRGDSGIFNCEPKPVKFTAMPPASKSPAKKKLSRDGSTTSQFERVSNTTPPQRKLNRDDSSISQCKRISNKKEVQSKVNQDDSGVSYCDRISVKAPAEAKLNRGDSCINSQCENAAKLPVLNTLDPSKSISPCERISVNQLVQEKATSDLSSGNQKLVGLCKPPYPSILKHKQSSTDSTIRISMLTTLETPTEN